MGTYAEFLPEVFPWYSDVSLRTAQSIAIMLISPGQPTSENVRVSEGSSFAVTAQGGPGKRRLWLSAVSYDRVVASKLYREALWAPTNRGR